MSEKRRKTAPTIPAPAPLPRGVGDSGEHPAVKTMRAKLESISDHELEDMKKLNERLAKVTMPAPKDPRRDGDSDPPVDVVEPPHEKE